MASHGVFNAIYDNEIDGCVEKFIKEGRFNSTK